MRTNVFIDKVERLGYECELHGEAIFINRLYGHDLRSRIKVATIIIAAPYNARMSLDSVDVACGLGDLILEYCASSKRQRGQLFSYNFKDGNIYNQ